VHGPIRVAFTPDEEVGRGTEHFDVKRFAATYAYTVDGSGVGELESETFCADTAFLTVTGADVHPGYAKGKMINALRVVSGVRCCGSAMMTSASTRTAFVILPLA
jgi:tripeptide aminopeptidase